MYFTIPPPTSPENWQLTDKDRTYRRIEFEKGSAALKRAGAIE
jgi:hypothetical protein